MARAMFESEERGLPLLRRGKVRDVYQPSAEHLLIVACDRISAFDRVLPTPIPDQGRVLTQMSRWWFAQTAHISPYHLLPDVPEIVPVLGEMETVALLILAVSASMRFVPEYLITEHEAAIVAGSSYFHQDMHKAVQQAIEKRHRAG